MTLDVNVKKYKRIEMSSPSLFPTILLSNTRERKEQKTVITDYPLQPQTYNLYPNKKHFCTNPPDAPSPPQKRGSPAPATQFLGPRQPRTRRHAFKRAHGQLQLLGSIGAGPTARARLYAAPLPTNKLAADEYPAAIVAAAARLLALYHGAVLRA